MQTEAAPAWDIFDETAFDEGVFDGKEESLLTDGQLEAHVSMGDEYCTGFAFGVMAGRAFDAGFKACDHLNFCCCHLADEDDPDLADEWMAGLWIAFSDRNGRGFSA